MKNYIVHKFGGSSLADTERLENVFKVILEEHKGLSAVVLSAMGGVTDRLVEICDLSVKDPDSCQKKVQELESHFEKVSSEFLSKTSSLKFIDDLKKGSSDLKDVIKSISIVKECSEQNHDFIVGLGEVWTTKLMSLKFIDAELKCSWVDAREVLIVEDTEIGKKADFKKSKSKMDSYLNNIDKEFLIITVL